MTGSHVGLHFILKSLGENNRVEEYCRLSHLSLAKIFIGTVKHQVGDAESKNVISFFKHFTGHGIVIVVLAHTYELRTLTGEYKCLHNVYVIGKLLNKATKLRIFPQLRSHLGLNSYLYIHKLHILTSID